MKRKMGIPKFIVFIYKINTYEIAGETKLNANKNQQRQMKTQNPEKTFMLFSHDWIERV